MKNSVIKFFKSFFLALFSKHKKHLPKGLEGRILGEICKYGICIFFSAWLFQGIHYMNWREGIIKVLFDSFFVFVFVFFLSLDFSVSFILAHTLNFLFNGQFVAMFTHMGVLCLSADKFLFETKALRDRLSSEKCLSAAIAYGSLSRGCYRLTSDIDIRFIPAKNKFWICCFYALRERCICFVKGYPLDLYVFDSNKIDKKMRSDELPILFVESSYNGIGCLKDIYPERVEFLDFVRVFTEKNLK